LHSAIDKAEGDILIDVFDYDFFSSNDMIGSYTLPFASLVKDKTFSGVVTLKEKKKGDAGLSFSLRPPFLPSFSPQFPLSGFLRIEFIYDADVTYAFFLCSFFLFLFLFFYHSTTNSLVTPPPRASPLVVRSF
jgi:hypothetical protein